MKLQITPTLTAYTDNTEVIERMKSLGLGKLANDYQKQNKNAAVLTPDGEAFLYCGKKGDTGFMSFKTIDLLERFALFMMVNTFLTTGEIPENFYNPFNNATVH